MRRIFLSPLLLLLVFRGALSSTIPPLMCHELTKLRIDPVSFETSRRNSKDVKKLDLYRFEDDKVFISIPSQPDYFYGSIQKVSDSRFVSEQKTFVFSNDFAQGIVVHLSNSEISTTKLRCLHKK